MITPDETMWIIIGVLFISLSFTTWAVYLLAKEIKKLKNAILGESKQ